MLAVMICDLLHLLSVFCQLEGIYLLFATISLKIRKCDKISELGIKDISYG